MCKRGCSGKMGEVHEKFHESGRVHEKHHMGQGVCKSCCVGEGRSGMVSERSSTGWEALSEEAGKKGFKW